MKSAKLGLFFLIWIYGLFIYGLLHANIPNIAPFIFVIIVLLAATLLSVFTKEKHEVIKLILRYIVPVFCLDICFLAMELGTGYSQLVIVLMNISVIFISFHLAGRGDRHWAESGDRH